MIFKNLPSKLHGCTYHQYHIYCLVLLNKMFKILKLEQEVEITIKRKETSSPLEMAIIHQPALATANLIKILFSQ